VAISPLLAPEARLWIPPGGVPEVGRSRAAEKRALTDLANSTKLNRFNVLRDKRARLGGANRTPWQAGQLA